MKKRIGLIITIIIIALVVGLLIWRFWPRPSSGLMPVDESSFTGVSAIAMVSGLEDGAFYSHTYRIDSTQQQSNEPGNILEILAASHYRPDFRNLLPWDLDTLSSGKNYDGRTVSLVFSTKDQETIVYIRFLSSSLISVQIGDQSGFRIYHPTNRNTIDTLVEYLQTVGVEQ